MKSAPRIDLVGQAVDAELGRIGKGVAGGADKQPGRAVDLLVVEELAFVAHLFDHAMSCMLSRSKTFLASGWLPNFWWSPDRQSMLRMPRA
jgi:hypothetical protein